MSTAVEQRPPMEVVCSTIASDEFRAKIEQALPPGLAVDRFVRTTLTAIQQNPDLITCSRQSLFNAVIRCSQDGLLPDGREAALVKYRGKGTDVCQYLPMIGGLRKRAAEFGIALAAHVVFANDEFDWWLGITPGIKHNPPVLSSDRGEPIGAYAVATDAEGRHYLEVMSKQEIEDVRKVSWAATSEYGPWVNWWGEMARKTVARRLWKQLPLADIDARTRRVLEAADAEFDLDREQKMTVEQANVHAAIDTSRIPDDGPPNDGIEDAEFVAVEDSAAEPDGPDRAEGASTPQDSPSAEPSEPVDTGGAGVRPSVSSAAEEEPVPPVGADGSQQAGSATDSAKHGADPVPGPGEQAELSFADKARIAQENVAKAGRPS